MGVNSRQSQRNPHQTGSIPVFMLAQRYDSRNQGKPAGNQRHRSPKMEIEMKKQMRRSIAAVLRATSDQEITRQSALVADTLATLPEFTRASALSVYLHMPKEAATDAILTTAFAASKAVFVPKITGKQADDLQMVRALSLEDIAGFPKDKWDIPDPPVVTSTGELRDDAFSALSLDLIVLPGVAFDRRGGRLGHGKGYYDSFLRRLGERYAAIGKARPKTVGLCLTAQLVDAVPLAPHDRMLDVIVTPDEVIRLTTETD